LWARQMFRIGEEINAFGILVKKNLIIENLEDISIDYRMVEK
jgi:hypothetical protein